MQISIKRVRSRIRKFFRMKPLATEPKDLKTRFTEVYERGDWGSTESASGPGSTLDSGSVHQALRVLPQMVEKYGIQSIADVPCGDFNWMPQFLKAHPDIDYTGYDIVDRLIAENQRNYPEVSFRALDITTQIPERADLVFSKDMVNHLVDADVWKAIANMVRSGATYLLITSNSDPVPNEELPRNVGGMSRILNLRIAPYDFPAPLYDDGYVAMWRTSDLAFVLDRAA